MTPTLRVPNYVNSRAIQARNDLATVATTLTGVTTPAALNTAEQAVRRVEATIRQLKADIRTMKRAAQEETRRYATERRMAEIGMEVRV